MTSASHGQYQALLEKIESLGQRQHEAFGSQIRCKVGCYSCCKPPDSFFQVEAETLQAAISNLPSEEFEPITVQLDAYIRGERELCPLLNEDKQGACRVYDARPTICRTHGFAIWLRNGLDEDEAQDIEPSERVSWCELNFTEEQPTREIAFDVERLNMMLSLITQLGWKEQPPRKALVDIIQEGLAQAKGTQ